MAKNSKHFIFRASYCPESASSISLYSDETFDWKKLQIHQHALRSGDAWARSGAIEVADKLVLEGKYAFRNYGEESVQVPVDWGLGQPSRDNLSWQLHSLPFLRDLIFAHSQTCDAKYIDAAFLLIKNWFEKNTSDPLPSPFSWNDHTTALRLVNLSYFFVYILKCIPTEVDQLEFISLLADRHIQVLACEDFYVKGTNHGLDQAFALYQATLVFNFLKSSNDTKGVALARLNYELNKSFSTEHVHIENSPEYHYVILSSTLQVNSYVEAVEGNGLLGNTGEFIEGALKFLAHCLKPDGKLVPIGDTLDLPPKNDFKWLDKYSGYNQYRFALTKGVEGTPLEARCQVYPDSGYAFLHGNRKLPYDQHLHMVFKCGFLSHYHRQDDDNNITLFAYGEEWLADGGLYKHDHSDPQREYIRSHYAHNIVAPIDAKAERRYCPSPPPRITEWAIDEYSATITGFTSMYRGYEWRRKLTYAFEDEFSVVDDICIIDSSDEKNFTGYEQFWQIPYDKNVEVHGNIIIVGSKDGRSALRMYLSAESDFDIKIIGQTASDKRYRSKDYNVLEPVQLVRINYSGIKSLSVSTIFRFSSNKFRILLPPRT